MTILDIFAVEKEGEKDNFNSELENRYKPPSSVTILGNKNDNYRKIFLLITKVQYTAYVPKGKFFIWSVSHRPFICSAQTRAQAY